MKTALITGITGQDGAYLSKLLLEKGYQVVGVIRSRANSSLMGLEYLHIKDEIYYEECNLLDLESVKNLIRKYKPQEIYNLAAQSSVGMSFINPIATIQFNVLSVINLLETIKLIDREIKFYQASSSEMFGKVEELPINEKTVIHPLSPYAISKASAHWTAINYREAFDIFTCCGVLFNHESVLRTSDFFVKKVIKEAIKIKNGLIDELRVGNIDIKRDFGYAPLYVDAMYRILQQNKPDDFIICSGESITLRSIIEYVFEYLGIPRQKIIIDPTLYRPLEIENIYGDHSKAVEKLGWKYNVNFFQVLDILLDEEIRLNKGEYNGL